MMYYIVCENGIFKADRKTWEESFRGIGIFDSDEWGRELKIKERFSFNQREEQAYFCRLEAHGSYFFGTFHIPVKKKERRSFDFAVYILKDRLIFIEDKSYVKDLLQKFLARKIAEGSDPLGQFLEDFFMAAVEDDVLYLASIERNIADLEESILQGDMEHFHYHMLSIKKEISRLYCYYSQMEDVAEILEREWGWCGNFSKRVRRLQEEAQSLREYAMQVQDVYQAEISIHQNNIMKLLTVVTTIFLPLTLIAGWYGMNFYNMPELRSKYGYPAVSAISLFVMIGSLWYFKKKKIL